ncbi:hypothetical protein [Stenotrophomonas maltophilia]|uniref:hypothetical protein n=1 Tax=Stenotrophomonas maltophilia TaxID=40324 RepID=UPI0006AC7DD0|nr:hypothetical protein [Stenotrophomonas maltophilia]KOQ69952.1 hypothetical protein ABW43_07415 [Stenotrophomonas maltophilia]
MIQHPIALLVPAALNAMLVGFCIALAATAYPRSAESFVLLGLGCAVLFACRAVVEARQAWRPFVAGLAQRRASRRSAPLTRINFPKDDIR